MIPHQLLMTYGEVPPVDDGDATASLAWTLGVALEGASVTCTFNDNDPDGAASGITYQWFRNTSTLISGATSSTYTATSSDVGGTVRCRVNYTDAEGFSESIFTPNSDTIGDVTPGATSLTSGSGTYTVPNYNTLRIQVWGAGASGQSWKSNAGSPNVHGGNAGGSSSGWTLSATGGQPAATTSLTSLPQSLTGGSAGTGSGGSDNQTGTAGGSGQQQTGGSPITSGLGGGGASGDGNAAGVQDTDNSVASTVTGTNGRAPGGGGAGGSNYTSGINCSAAGGGGGGYASRFFTRGVDGPSIGAGLSYAVGAGGSAVAATGADTGCLGGNGARGEVIFTVVD